MRKQRTFANGVVIGSNRPRAEVPSVRTDLRRPPEAGIPRHRRDMDVERRNERQPKAGDNDVAPQLRVGRHEVSRDAHRNRHAVRISEAPLVSEWVEGVANAVVGRKIGRAHRLGVGLEI